MGGSEREERRGEVVYYSTRVVVHNFTIHIHPKLPDYSSGMYV